LAALACAVAPAAGRPRVAHADPVSSVTLAATTVSGQGRFADLKITVSQTEGLIDQVVKISWTGGRPTLPQTGTSFSHNFLQLRQCWGDDAGGPKREQCQYGALEGDGRGFGQVTSRQLPSGVLIDPEDPPPADGSVPFLPFTSVSGKTGPG